MANKTSIRFFEDVPVRAVWDDESAKWWFCAMDIRPAGGHPENLPRTRRDHAGATRQESARPDRENGIFNSQKKQRI